VGNVEVTVEFKTNPAQVQAAAQQSSQQFAQQFNSAFAKFQGQAFSKTFNKSLSDFENKFAKTADNVRSSFGKIDAAAARTGGIFGRLGAQGKNLNEQFAGVGARIAGVGFRLGNLTPAAIAAGAALAGVAGSLKLIEAGIGAAANIERIETALGGIFQLDPTQTEETLRLIQDFAARTPFTLETANTAVLKLKATFDSLTPQGALDVLKQIASAGAAIGATDDQINRAVLAITQMGASGKLTADNLRQLTEALPDISRAKITEQLAKNLGKTADEIRRLQDEGGITANQGIQAILDVIGQIPGIQGALERQALTFSGLVSKITDEVTQLLADAAKPLLEAFKEFIPVISDIIKDIGPQLRDFFVNVGNAIKIMLPTIVVLIKGFASFTTAISTLFPLAAGLISHAILPLTQAISILTPIVNVLAAAFTKLNSIVVDALAKVLGPLKEVIKFASKIPGVGFVVKQLGIDFEKASEGPDALAGTVDSAKKALQELVPVFKDLKTTFENTLGESGLLGNFKAIQEAAAGNVDFFTGVIKSIEDALSGIDPVIKAQEKLNKLLAEGKVNEKEVETAEKALADARRQSTKDTNDRIEAEEALAEVLKPATADELSEAEDKLTQARIDLARATREVAKSEEELNEESGGRLNLAGKTLAQIKEILANERASAAARSKAAKEDKKEKKSEVERLEDIEELRIKERDAIRDVRDAELALQEIRSKGGESDPKVIQARKDLAEAQADEKDSIDEITSAQNKLNEAKAGDPLFDGKLAEAQLELNALVAVQLGDQQKILDAKLAQLDADRKILGANRDLVKSIITPLVQSLAGNIAGPGTTGPSLIDDIINAILNNPNLPFRQIFRQFGVPGFAEGGSFSKATLGVFGEDGREIIAPMTKPFRAAQLLGKDPAWPAIQSHIARLNLPQRGVQAPVSLLPRSSWTGGNGPLQVSASYEARILALLEEIRDRTKGIQVDAPITIQQQGLDETLLARRAIQALERKILRSL
jgi:tape measure domain-containing protein